MISGIYAPIDRHGDVGDEGVNPLCERSDLTYDTPPAFSRLPAGISLVLGRPDDGRAGVLRSCPLDTTSSTLLARLKDAEDDEAWRDFDHLYRPLIFGYAQGLGLDAADAEDVVQSCAQAVLANIARYQHVGSFKAWLRRIALNKVRDASRRRGEVQGDTAQLAGAADPAPTPDELWERRWLEEHLRFCLERVRSDFARHTYEAFYRIVFREHSPAQVAEELRLSLNQVYVAKHRVLDRVRDQMLQLSGVQLG